jgi:preprotein translocase subunit SecE
MFNKIVQFVKDVRVEFTKVSWPSRDELIQSTIVVGVVSLVVTAFIGAVDRLLSLGITFFLGRF